MNEPPRRAVRLRHRWLSLGLLVGMLACSLQPGVAGVHSAPAPDTTYTVDVFDVGTGLSVLVRGPSWNVLFDGGSQDEHKSKNRLFDLLDSAGVPDSSKLDYLILSHPHKDHVLLLPDIVARYEVGQVWDSGALNETCVYYDFLKAIEDKQADGDLVYRTALYGETTSFRPGFDGSRCYGSDGTASDTLDLEYGPQLIGAQSSRANATTVTFADGATMTVLHATDPKAPDYRANDTDYNDFSFVVRFQFGDQVVLLTGDAQGGHRETPMDHPDEDDSIEKKLLDCCMDLLPADAMVVGHHGSETSSRDEFLDAVDGRDTRDQIPHAPVPNVRTMFYAVSSGPYAYSKVELPDSVVISDLRARFSTPDEHVFRTDLHDLACSASKNNVKPCSIPSAPAAVVCTARKAGPARIGDGTNGPYGGCDNIRFTVNGSGIRAAYWPAPGS